MKKSIYKLVVGVGLLINISFCFADDNVLTKVKYTFDVPESANIEKVKVALKDAITGSASDKVTEVNGFEPDTIPEKPGSVTFQQGSTSTSIMGGIISNYMASNGQTVAMGAQLGDAVYGIKGYSSSGFKGVMGFGNNVTYEGYVGAIYRYQGGYRVYIYGIFNQEKDWLGKSTEWMVNKAFLLELPVTYMKVIHARDKFIEEEPQAKMIRQEPEWLSQYKSSGGVWNSVNKISESTALSQKTESVTTPTIP